MRRFSAKALEVIAAIRTGEYRDDIAARFGITKKYVEIIASNAGVKVASRHRDRGQYLRDAIRAGYAANRPPKDIAADLGISSGNVKVQACKMGLTRGRHDTGIHRRGYAIPEELMPRYRELRRLGLKFDECGYELGLLQRPQKSRAA